MIQKIIQYNGLDFYLNGKKRYYYHTYFLNGKKKYKALHRLIYEENFGDIPKGFHIHHKDHNCFNNNPDNLVCIQGREHQSYHMKDKWKNDKKYVKKSLRHLDEIRLLASKWHGSKDGIEAHKIIGKKSWENRERMTMECVNCGKSYKSFRPDSLYCTNICFQKYIYKTKRHFEQRICITCKNAFETKKYSKAKNCSKRCAAFYRERII